MINLIPSHLNKYVDCPVGGFSWCKGLRFEAIGFVENSDAHKLKKIHNYSMDTTLRRVNHRWSF